MMKGMIGPQLNCRLLSPPHWRDLGFNERSAFNLALSIALHKGYELTYTLLGQFNYRQRLCKLALLSPTKLAIKGAVRSETSLAECRWKESEPGYWFARNRNATIPFTDRQLPIKNIQPYGQADEAVGDRAVHFIRADIDALGLICGTDPFNFGKEIRRFSRYQLFTCGELHISSLSSFCSKMLKERVARRSERRS